MKTIPRIIAKLPSTLEIPPSPTMVAPVEMKRIPPSKFMINSRSEGFVPSK